MIKIRQIEFDLSKCTPETQRQYREAQAAATYADGPKQEADAVGLIEKANAAVFAELAAGMAIRAAMSGKILPSGQMVAAEPLTKDTRRLTLRK